MSITRPIQIELIKFVKSEYNVEIISSDIQKPELNAFVSTFSYRNSFEKKKDCRYQRFRYQELSN